MVRHIDLRSAGIGLRLIRDLVSGEILRRHADHLGLNAGHNVPRNQDGRRPLLHKAPAHLQQAAVPAVWVHPLRKRHVYMVDLQPQRPSAGEGDPFHQAPLPAQPLQKADHLPGVAALLSLRLLQLVQLLQYRQRQHNVVVLKGLQRVRGMDQHIGVQHIGFLHRRSCLS